jgi:hypothetical protein
MNIREHIATEGLKTSIEGNYGLPVILIPPDGIEINTNTDGDQLKGQVLYDRERMDPDNGDLISIGETKVTLRKTALSQVPVNGETWYCKVPINPAFPDVMTDKYLVEGSRAIVDGRSMGFITLTPITAGQL